MTERISQLFDYGDEIVVDGLENPFDPAQIKEITMNRIHSERNEKPARVKARRVTRTLLLAAVLSALFVTSALAVGLSVHSRRQEQLNQTLTQGQTIAGYTEFEVPAEEESGVTLLSTVSDGEFEWLWLNLSPIEESEIISPFVGVETEEGRCYSNVAFRLPGEEEATSTIDMANMVVFDDADWVTTADGGRTVTPERIEQRYREQYYDAQSMTMTVQIHIPVDRLRVGEPTELEVYIKTRTEGREKVEERLFGTCTFTPVGEETLIFMFPEPWNFENPETGGQGQILGIELVASGANTFVTHEDIEKVYTDDPKHRNVYVADGQMDLWVSWANAEDKTVADNMHLNLADGSTAPVGGYLASGGREGKVEKLLASGRETLWDIHSVVSVTVGENTWEIPGHK